MSPATAAAASARWPGSKGEGALHVQLRDGAVRERRAARSTNRRGSSRRSCAGAQYTEPPDITARICGICPVAYQTSACNAIEDACGVERRRAARRAAPAAVLRGVDLQPRPAHLPAARAGLPRLPGRDRAGARPPGHRRTRAGAEEGRQRDARGRRRPGDPPGQRAASAASTGRRPAAELGPLAERLRRALDDALATVAVGGRRSTSPTSNSTTTCSPLHAPGPLRRSRAATDRAQPAGRRSRPREFTEHVVEHAGAALHRAARRLWTAAATSPARWPGTRSTRRSSRRSPAQAAADAGLGRDSAATRSAASSCAPSRWSTRSRRRCGSSTATSAPHARASRCRPAPGSGHGVSEAPRGLLYHRYETRRRRADRGGDHRPADLAEPGGDRGRPAPRRVGQPRPRRRRADRAVRADDPQLRPVHLLLGALPRASPWIGGDTPHRRHRHRQRVPQRRRCRVDRGRRDQRAEAPWCLCRGRNRGPNGSAGCLVWRSSRIGHRRGDRISIDARPYPSGYSRRCGFSTRKLVRTASMSPRVRTRSDARPGTRRGWWCSPSKPRTWVTVSD